MRAKLEAFLLLTAVLVVWSGAATAEAPDSAAVTETEAQSAAQPVLETAPSRQAPVPGVGGMLAAVDPETGQLRQPTPEEVAALAAELELAFAAESFVPRELVLDSGAVAAELGASLQKFAAVRVEADGTLSHHCIQGHDAASEFVAKATAEKE